MLNKKYSTLLVGIVLAMILLFSSLIFDLDIFEKFTMFIVNYEQFELDEFVFPLFILVIFAYLNETERRHAVLVGEEKSKIYQAMAHASKQVIIDFISEIELFKLKAINTNAFTTEELKIFTDALREANIHLEALCSVTNINEEEIYDTVLKSYGSK